MTWVFLNPLFDDTSTHAPPRTVCEESVVPALEAVWAATVQPGMVVAKMECKPQGSAWLDLGGIAQVNRKIYRLDPIDGLILTVPARDVGDYLDILAARAERKPERIGEGSYYTIPSMHLGILLSINQCILLALRLRGIVAEADAIASVENDAFNQDMASTKLVHAPLRPVKRPIEEA
jgi:hypothetical protein